MRVSEDPQKKKTKPMKAMEQCCSLCRYYKLRGWGANKKQRRWGRQRACKTGLGRRVVGAWAKMEKAGRGREGEAT